VRGARRGRSTRSLASYESIKKLRVIIAGPHVEDGLSHGHPEGAPQEGVRGLPRRLRGACTARRPCRERLGRTRDGPRRLRGLAAASSRGPQPVVGATPADVVHEEHKWRLLRYARAPRGVARVPHAGAARAVAHQPALRARPDAGRASPSALVAAGARRLHHRLGHAQDEDRWVSFDDIVDTLHRPRPARRPRGTAGRRPTCSAIVWAAPWRPFTPRRTPQRYRLARALAAPVGFHDDGLLSLWTNTRSSFDVRGVSCDACGQRALADDAGGVSAPSSHAPAREGHALLRPRWDDEFLDGFLALETWGNDNVSFPGGLLAHGTSKSSTERRPGRGALTLSGAPRACSSPSPAPPCAVTFEHDNIVPHKSASILMEHIASADAEHVHLPGGHVGAMVSSSAAKKLWPRMRAFWASRDGRPEGVTEGTSREPVAARPVRS
jgi:polyhydroxyalkanoate synthase